MNERRHETVDFLRHQVKRIKREGETAADRLKLLTSLAVQQQAAQIRSDEISLLVHDLTDWLATGIRNGLGADPAALRDPRTDLWEHGLAEIAEHSQCTEDEHGVCEKHLELENKPHCVYQYARALLGQEPEASR